MTITPAQKSIIENVVDCFETGSPEGNYGEICLYRDGHDGERQITYGRSQTTEQGNLKDLIALYVDKGGKWAKDFREYLPKIGHVPLAGDAIFKLLLENAGHDPVMIAAEDEFFDYDYYRPALAWAQGKGFTTALSLLVIYDSWIHSGGMLQFLRRRFKELPPSLGGDEKIWIKSYVMVRGDWLRTYSDPLHLEKQNLLRKTVYRTNDLMRQVVAQNWNLDQLPILANGVEVSS